MIHAQSGQISSPNYPNNYQSSVECIWDINVQPGYHINIAFDDNFAIEHAPNCSNDYVQVSFTILTRLAELIVSPFKSCLSVCVSVC